VKSGKEGGVGSMGHCHEIFRFRFLSSALQVPTHMSRKELKFRRKVIDVFVFINDSPVYFPPPEIRSKIPFGRTFFQDEPRLIGIAS
jgi:hypothetical protein